MPASANCSYLWFLHKALHLAIFIDDHDTYMPQPWQKHPLQRGRFEYRLQQAQQFAPLCNSQLKQQVLPQTASFPRQELAKLDARAPAGVLLVAPSRSVLHPARTVKPGSPYFEGSSTFVTRMVASAPRAVWKSSMSFMGYGQTTSLFSTKNGLPEPSSSKCRASARGPAVPMGSVSCTAQSPAHAPWQGSEYGTMRNLSAPAMVVPHAKCEKAAACHSDWQCPHLDHVHKQARKSWLPGDCDSVSTIPFARSQLHSFPPENTQS